MAGIVHFSVFFAYMEEAEHEFWRAVGLGVIQKIDDYTISWPRVHAECNYRNAIRFEDEIDIEVSVIRIGKKSVAFGFQFFLKDVLVANGNVTAVCCRFDQKLTHERPQSIEIPQEIVEALTPFVPV